MNIPKRLNSGKVVVTGGNGFIGRHVVDRLINLNFKVTVLDRLNYSFSDDVNFVLGDVRNLVTVESLLSSHDGVINLAGILGTSETIDNPRGTVSSNLKGALNIFNSAKKFNIPAVHITVGNYWMNNPYAITKHAAEKIALNYNDQFGTKITVVRGLNAYGEGQKDYPVRKLMPNLVIPALKNSEILIYGDGTQIMDMIYVKDLAKVLVNGLTLEHGCWDKIIEGGSGEKTTVNDICDVVMAQTKSTAKVTHVPMRGGEPDRAIVLGDPSTMLPLGINKSDLITLDEGVKRSVAFYRDYIKN